MKRFYSFFSIFLLSSIFLTSCNDKVELVGDFTETAIVYGLLNKSESIHFIKINRAFIGPGNSLEIAQIPDSSYFDQVDATVTEFIGGVQTREWTLIDTLIENKDTDGVFYAPTQKLYYFATTSTSPLVDNATYKLHISINGGLFEVNGQTEIISGLYTAAEEQNFRFNFVDDPGIYTQKGLLVSTGNSYIVNTTLKVNFEEIRSSLSDTTIKSFTWKLGETPTTPNQSISFNMNGKTFYELVKSNATNDPLIDKRRMKSVEVIATGGTLDLYNYMLVNQPSSSLAQNKPTYTNLTVSDGFRVIGIFTSRQTHAREKTYINPSNSNLRMMAVKSVVELCTGPITGNLYFCSQHPGDIGESYSCQ